MSVDAPPRPVALVAPGHVHDRTCFWDVLACRWAGPAHAAPTDTRLPAPRRSPEA
ncbi:hypothetical protein [Actinomycetospora aeridis]|uniref:Uncharacterized protein n=1 Tax=Actinomycetospora aeridis TaxID=3129231 RepID=A0ABU8MZD4_9PSEU